MNDIVLGVVMCAQGCAMMVLRRQIAVWGMRWCRMLWDMEFDTHAPKGRVIGVLGAIIALGGVSQLWMALRAP